MREVDARGLSCPEPLMLTAEAIKSDSSPVKVLVTEPHQKQMWRNLQGSRKENNSRRNRRWICCCDRVK